MMMTLQTGTTGGKPGRGLSGFTLVELILVMAILSVIMAIVMPTLSQSLRGRALEQEAMRFLALTELARDEAISQGAAMTVWVDTQNQRFGLRPADAYSTSEFSREYPLESDIRFDAVAGVVRSNGEAISFRPDGTLEVSSITSVRLSDRTNSAIEIVRQENGWGYEIAKLSK